MFFKLLRWLGDNILARDIIAAVNAKQIGKKIPNKNTFLVSSKKPKIRGKRGKNEADVIDEQLTKAPYDLEYYYEWKDIKTLTNLIGKEPYSTITSDDLKAMGEAENAIPEGSSMNCFARLCGKM